MKTYLLAAVAALVLGGSARAFPPPDEITACEFRTYLLLARQQIPPQQTFGGWLSEKLFGVTDPERDSKVGLFTVYAQHAASVGATRSPSVGASWWFLPFKTTMDMLSLYKNPAPKALENTIDWMI
jgi:hypothetical protein